MSSPSESTESKHVVIVEDNTTTNDLLCDWLKPHFSVSGYLDAEAALKALSTPSADPIVFVVDYNLPGMNGIDLRAKLGSKFPAAKYILISGLFDEKLLTEAHNAGYDATLPKPFPMPSLFKKVQDLFALPAAQPNLVEKIKQQSA